MARSARPRSSRSVDSPIAIHLSAHGFSWARCGPVSAVIRLVTDENRIIRIGPFALTNHPIRTRLQHDISVLFVADRGTIPTNAQDALGFSERILRQQFAVSVENR